VQISTKVLEACCDQKISDWTTKKNKIRSGVSELIYEKTKKKAYDFTGYYGSLIFGCYLNCYTKSRSCGFLFL
jgi:hypothetical protein